MKQNLYASHSLHSASIQSVFHNLSFADMQYFAGGKIVRWSGRTNGRPGYEWKTETMVLVSHYVGLRLHVAFYTFCLLFLFEFYFIFGFWILLTFSLVFATIFFLTRRRKKRICSTVTGLNWGSPIYREISNIHTRT